MDYIKNFWIILEQFGGPIKLSYQTISLSNITYDIVEYHKNNINNFEIYSKIELFSLYWVIEYALKDLWENDFKTVTWLDLYIEWYRLLAIIKNNIIKNYKI